MDERIKTDLVILGVSLLATVAVCGVLVFARRGVKGQGWKDFLGITLVFFVLVEVTALMIVGENAAG
jgi:hypothetical protein